MAELWITCLLFCHKKPKPLKHRGTEEAEDFLDSNFKTPLTPFLCVAKVLNWGAAQKE
jgi:hypothetical protein